MSKKEVGDKPGVAPLKPIPLPTLPRCDDHNRDKWMNEYDKVEAELLKPHLGSVGATATTTLGLRLLPSHWDRTIPPMNEPSAGKRRDGETPRRAQTTEPAAMPTYANNRFSPRPNSARTVHTVTTPLPQMPSLNVGECARALLTLLNPPVQFRTSFSIDLRGVNIDWIKKYSSGDRLPNLLTIETIREDMLVNPSAQDDVAINSPRSVMVMLKNGVSVFDLQARTQQSFRGPDSTELVSRMAYEHYENRRKELLVSLRDEYRTLGNDVSLVDLLEAVSTVRGEAEMTGESTMIQRRREKQKYAAEINREKLQKQMEYQRETSERVMAAETKREQHERELMERRRMKKDEMAQASEATIKRMMELRESTALLNQEFIRKLEERRQRMEEKERALRAANAQRIQKKKEETEKRLMLKREKIEQNQEMLAKLQSERQERYETKERLVEQRRAKLEADKEAERKEAIKSMLRAQQSLEAARQRAKQHEQDVRNAAERKRQQAEQRLAQFFALRHKQREIELEKEEEKRDRMRRIFQAAESRERERKEQILSKRQHHEEQMDKVNEERDARLREQHQFEKLMQDDKRFYVDRQARALEFRKLISVSHIRKKESKADSISVQRQKLLQATLHDRELQRIEKEQMEQELQQLIRTISPVAAVSVPRRP